MNVPTYKIIVCGGGLAGLLTATRLQNDLGETTEITLIDDRRHADRDVFYGSVTAPTAYSFLRSVGLDEPRLFLNSGTSFSYGTAYRNWPSTQSEWVQCHHEALQPIEGIPLQHHITRTNQNLMPLLVSSQAALAGRFAHPPDDASNPLSRAEYGYQFNVKDWCDLLRVNIQTSGVKIVSSELDGIIVDNGEITAVTLGNGSEVTGDLFIDCTGAERGLISALGAEFTSTQTVSGSLEEKRVPQLGPPCRIVSATPSGWQSLTHLQNSVLSLNISSDATDSSTNAKKIEFGQLDAAWHGNCIAIGHAACTIDPLTPAPMVLLQRDVERLSSLIPSSKIMSVERNEFNRRFGDDTLNTLLFHQTFFTGLALPNGAYWQDGRASASTDALKRKLDQFESRGILVKYDLEPFNDEDWTILHNGMGRRPSRYDRQTDRLSTANIESTLATMRNNIINVVKRMPPHHIYVAKMKNYLEKQKL